MPRRYPIFAGIALTACLVCLATTPVRAQLSPMPQKARPLALRIGVLHPTSGSQFYPNFADVSFGSADPTSVAAGLSYDLGRTQAARMPFLYFVYIDGFTDGSANRQDHGLFSSGSIPTTGKGSGSGVGLGLSGRLFPIRRSPFYVGAGVGVYTMWAKIAFSPNGASYSGNNTGLGGKLFFGREIRNNFFGEAEWDTLPSVNVHSQHLTAYTSHISGLRFSVGYRM